jgi:hypothetical protein
MKNINDILYKYLQDEWKRNNSSKYQKYFEEWVNNLTENQIYYYNNLWRQS